MASITLMTQAGSRKCWPKRLRAIIPVLLFDRLDLVLAEAEVVADLVNQRLTDRHDEIVLIIRLALERTLKEQDAIGQRIPVAPLPFGQRNALIQTQQRAAGFDLHLVEQRRLRLVLDDNRDVALRVAKPPGNRRERFSDELFEWFAAHGGKQH